MTIDPLGTGMMIVGSLLMTWAIRRNRKLTRDELRKRVLQRLNGE